MSSVYLLFPELLLLLVPLGVLLLWRARAAGLNGFVRFVLLLILVLIASVPLARITGDGVDVVLIADLSRSMPEGSRGRQIEIIKLLEDRRGKGDRVGVVTFGRDARFDVQEARGLPTGAVLIVADHRARGRASGVEVHGT